MTRTLLASGTKASLVPPPTGGNNQNLYENPFIAASAHHRPIGSGAIYASATAASTLSWRNAKGHFSVNIGFPFGRVFYIVDNTDPTRTVNVNPDARNAIVGIPYTGLYPSGGVTMKQVSLPTDGCVAFLHRDTGAFQQFRECGPVGTTNTMNMVAGARILCWGKTNGNPDVGVTSGLGHGLFPGDRTAQGASGVSHVFGILRAFELNGTDPIRHVHQMTMGSRPKDGFMVMSKKARLPATSVDGFASDAGNNLGALDYGTVVALLPSTNLDNRGFPPWLRRLAQAWMDYGIIPVDVGGAAAIRADQDVTSAQKTAIANALELLADDFRPIENSAWDPNDRMKPTGGGTPRAPNSAFDASSPIVVSGRGRPQILGGILKSDVSRPLRGTTLSSGISNQTTPPPTVANNWAALRSRGITWVRCDVKLSQIGWTVAQQLPRIDAAVACAQAENMYISLNPSVAPGSFNNTDATDFWNAVASRFAGSPNVFYEWWNEPVSGGPHWGATSQWTSTILGQMRAIYNIIRAAAPNTMIALYSTPNVYPSSTDWQSAITAFEALGTVDWTKTCIAYHHYKGTMKCTVSGTGATPATDSGFAGLDNLRQFRPLFMTEVNDWHDDILAYEEPYLTQMHQVLRGYESRQWSWCFLDNDTMAHLDAAIDDLHANGYNWPVE